MPHLTIHQLLELQELGGSKALATEAAEHLQRCGRCRELYLLLNAIATQWSRSERREFLQAGRTCLKEAEVASYLEGESESQRHAVEEHLLSCRRCLHAVLDSYRLLHAPASGEPEEVPVWALRKAQAMERPKFGQRLRHLLAGWRGAFTNVPVGWRWAGAAATLIALVALTSVLGPLSPKQIARRGQVASGQLKLYAPRSTAWVQPEELRFRWQAISKAREYRVVVLDAIGDTTWTVLSTRAEAVPPPGMVEFRVGATYFWTVEAHLEDGSAVSSGLGCFGITSK
ncbi:MAG: zf-HC2 domain-containing protein [candidate division KSB1 bacterium]|nr:zf-HC2 domain-containing protein [candidate division KSB1 bacterium]MDZ7385199.1 zf-HC2 domain-containing protein [candidate division KSB1 bacterium]